MPELELCLLFVRPLNQLGVRYVISGSVAKLEYYREGRSEKHLRDIRAMLAVSAAELNQPELEDWIARRGLGTEWRAATT